MVSLANTSVYGRSYTISIISLVLVISFVAFPVMAAKPTGATPSAVKLLPPSMLNAQAAINNEVKLVWSDSNSDESGYSIERKASNDINFSVIAITSADITSYSDKSIVSGNSYSYRMRAFKNKRKSIDYSDYSTTANIEGVTIDTVAPEVSLSQPLNGSYFDAAQTLSITASATDNDAVSKVEFFDNEVLIGTDDIAPYAIDYAVDANKNGVHFLTAKAYDNSNNAGEANPASIDIEIDNIAPNIIITNPADGAQYTTEQTININATVSDNVGVVKVEFYRNGSLYFTDTVAPFIANWDIATAENNNYVWTAQAYDAAGNEATSAASNVSVNIAVNENDLIVDFGLLGPNSNNESKGRMAQFDDMTALLYTQGFGKEKWLYLRNESGDESLVSLPDLAEDKLFNAEYVLTSPTDFWIFSSKGKAAFGESGAPADVRHFELSGSGALPTTATLVESQSFGDVYGAAGSFIKLNSGALLGVWYRFTSDYTGWQDNYADLTFIYRSPEGEWSTLPPVRVDAFYGHFHNITLAQHPTDNSVWAFSKGDSFREIWAIHLSEDASGIAVDWVDDQYISQDLDGDNGPEVELPTLLAATDENTGTIVLAYQNKLNKSFSSTTFRKGAHVTIAKIQADGNRDFLVFPQYVERVYGLNALVIKQNELWLAYRPMVENDDSSDDDVYVTRYVNGAWEAGQYLATTYYATMAQNTATVGYSNSRARFAVSSNDYNVHLLTLD